MSKGPLVVALPNHKGGVGKTTSTLGFAEAATSAGYRVGVIDLDPNCTATEALEPQDLDVAGSKDILRDDRTLSLAECWVDAGEQWKGIQVCISDIKLTNRESDLNQPASETRLRDAIHRNPGDVDVIFVDTPPNRGRIGLTGLVAADYILAVTNASTYSTRLLSQMVEEMLPLSRRYNPDQQILGILLTKFAGRAEETRILRELTAVYGEDQMWVPSIPRHEVVATAHESYHSPLRDMNDQYATRVADAYAAHLPRLLAAGGLAPTKSA